MWRGAHKCYRRDLARSLGSRKVTLKWCGRACLPQSGGGVGKARGSPIEAAQQISKPLGKSRQASAACDTPSMCQASEMFRKGKRPFYWLLQHVGFWAWTFKQMAYGGLWHFSLPLLSQQGVSLWKLSPELGLAGSSPWMLQPLRYCSP